MKKIIMTFVTVLIAGFFASLAAQGPFKIMYNYGLERGDYKDFDLARPAWEECRNVCAAENACLSFTYTIPIAGANGRPAHCWLKNIVPRGEGRDWCISGIKGCGGDYGIQAPATVASGTRFNVSFSYRGAKPNSGDWIAVFPAGSNSWIEWYWVKDVNSCEKDFAAPAPGSYEMRYLLPGDPWPVAARSSFTVK